ncbi:MAG: iron-sulfur cluster repair di-iron protein [Candidatus Kapaibacterium sp.]
MITTKNTLADVVKSNYRAAVILQQHGLDFCCGGKATIEESCAKNHLDSEELLHELNALSLRDVAAAINRWEEWDLEFLIEYIKRNHHMYIRNSIPVIIRHLQKVRDKHGMRHQELVQIFDVFLALCEDLLEHLGKEEQVLFPYVKKLLRLQQAKLPQTNAPFASITSPIAVLEAEHERAGNLMITVRSLTNNYQAPANACNTFRLVYDELAEFDKDLMQHTFLENHILFPKSIELEKEITSYTKQ